MVKLPRSSKLPGLPRPSTAPPGAVPGTFCQAIGSRSAVVAEQRARSRGAARRSGKREAAEGCHPSTCTRSLATATVDARLQDGDRAGQRRVHRVVVVARLGPGESHGKALVGGEWYRRGELRAARRRDLVARGVLVDEVDLRAARNRDGARGDSGSGDLELDRALRTRAAAASQNEQGESNGNAHGSLLGKTTAHRHGRPKASECSRHDRSRVYGPARAPIRNVRTTSSSTLTSPPAAEVGSIPKSVCFTTIFPDALSASPCTSSRTGTLKTFVTPCRVSSASNVRSYELGAIRLPVTSTERNRMVP